MSMSTIMLIILSIISETVLGCNVDFYHNGNVCGYLPDGNAFVEPVADFCQSNDETDTFEFCRHQECN